MFNVGAGLRDERLGFRVRGVEFKKKKHRGVYERLGFRVRGVEFNFALGFKV
jgi:hypothetical protein